MSKNRYKIICLSLTAVLALSLAVSACTTESEPDQTQSAGDEEQVSDEAQVSDVEQAAGDREAGAGAAQTSGNQADKEETVHIKADASGKAEKITVESLLKNPGEGERIMDFSTLDDIKNVEGDEEFTQESNGTLLWDNHGEDITYEGTSDAELPVSVSVAYYLDGKEMTPEEIAGKSGNVRIRMDYENHVSQTVKIDGTQVEVKVPFAAISAVVLPEDTFSNVEVTNGKLISVGDQQAVIGYAFPGLADSLKLSEYEKAEDIEIPEYVEITAYVQDFELDFTATMVSNGIFEEIEEEDLEDLEEMTDSTEELEDASSELAEASGKLLQGAETMQSSLAGYIEGVSQVNKGTTALVDGLKELNGQKEALVSGAESLKQGIEDLHTALTRSDFAGQVQALAIQMASYGQSVQSLVTGAAEEMSKADLSEAEHTATEKAREQARAAAEEILADMDGVTEEEKTQILEHISGSIDVSGTTEEAQRHLAQAQSALSRIPAFDQTTTGLDDSGDDSTDFGRLLDGLEQLKNGSGQLAEGITAFSQGIGQLYAGAAALQEGTQTLSDSGTDLKDGMEVLKDGMGTFREGMYTFDKEGIQKLAELAGDDLENVLRRIRALKEADSGYQNYSGIREGQKGSVRFLFETEEI